MRVLIGCEESATVREAFARRGHDAWSCDLLFSRIPGKHMRCDIAEAINGGWDLIILHPDCTKLSLSGNGTYGIGKYKHPRRIEALDWTENLWRKARGLCGKVCLEQPKSILVQRLGKADQTIHPWQFGHMEQKETWLWLHGLPALVPTKDVKQEMLKLPVKKRCRVFHMSPGYRRKRDRSKTYAGIAAAMADQWGSL